jgi:hypothetical protein
MFVLFAEITGVATGSYVTVTVAELEHPVGREAVTL